MGRHRTPRISELEMFFRKWCRGVLYLGSKIRDSEFAMTFQRSTVVCTSCFDFQRELAYRSAPAIRLDPYLPQPSFAVVADTFESAHGHGAMVVPALLSSILRILL